MANGQKKYFYTYKVTLLKGSLAGHYYYGQHTTRNLSDGYAGSGTIIKDYFKHYGKIEGVTYVKQILAFYNDPDELNRAERDLIDDRYETDKLCLNLRAGGNQPGFSEEIRTKISTSRKGKHMSKESKAKISTANKGKHPTEEVRAKMSASLKGHPGWNKGKTPWNKGKTQIYSEETRAHISNSLKGRHPTEETRAKMSASLKGENGPWFGKHLSEKHRQKISTARKGKNIWITNGKESKSINKNNLEKYIELGYVRGRKIA